MRLSMKSENPLLLFLGLMGGAYLVGRLDPDSGKVCDKQGFYIYPGKLKRKKSFSFIVWCSIFLYEACSPGFLPILWGQTLPFSPKYLWVFKTKKPLGLLHVSLFFDNFV